jgi:periplasmic protein CpxP/Spy
MKSKLWNKKGLIIIMILMLVPVFHGKIFSQAKQQSNQSRQEKSQTIIPEQKLQIKTILSRYNSKTLTSDQAKSIHEEFRKAGIHAGPETKDAIIAAGFDPEKLRKLDPPTSDQSKGESKQPSSEERLKMVQEKVIKPLSLSLSQEEKVTSAFKNYFSELENLRKIQSNPKEPLEKSKVEPLEKARDEKIKALLSAEQFKKYLELEKAIRPPKPEDQKMEKK